MSKVLVSADIRNKLIQAYIAPEFVQDWTLLDRQCDELLLGQMSLEDRDLFVRIQKFIKVAIQLNFTKATKTDIEYARARCVLLHKVWFDPQTIYKKFVTIALFGGPDETINDIFYDLDKSYNNI